MINKEVISEARNPQRRTWWIELRARRTNGNGPAAAEVSLSSERLMTRQQLLEARRREPLLNLLLVLGKVQGRRSLMATVVWADPATPELVSVDNDDFGLDQADQELILHAALNDLLPTACKHARKSFNLTQWLGNHFYFSVASRLDKLLQAACASPPSSRSSERNAP